MVLLVTMCMLNKVWSVPWNKIAKAVIIIILLICFAYFVHEVFVKYVAKETNFSQQLRKKILSIVQLPQCALILHSKNRRENFTTYLKLSITILVLTKWNL